MTTSVRRVLLCGTAAIALLGACRQAEAQPVAATRADAEAPIDQIGDPSPAPTHGGALIRLSKRGEPGVLALNIGGLEGLPETADGDVVLAFVSAGRACSAPAVALATFTAQDGIAVERTAVRLTQIEDGTLCAEGLVAILPRGESLLLTGATRLTIEIAERRFALSAAELETFRRELRARATPPR